MIKILAVTLILFITMGAFAETIKLGSGEVTMKTKRTYSPLYKTENIFIRDNKEIARQVLGENYKIIEQSGNIPDGIVNLYNTRGQKIAEINYKNNKMNGLSKHYQNNIIIKEENFVDGVKEGVIRSYDLQGCLFSEEYMENNELVGERKSFYKSGELKTITIYQDVQRLSMKVYYENGKLKSETNYKNGKVESGRRYDESGKLKKTTKKEWEAFVETLEGSSGEEQQ